MDGSRLSGESLHDEGKQFDTTGSCSVIVLLTFNDAVGLSWAQYSSLLLYFLTLVSFILSAFHSLNILPSTVLSTQWVHSQCLLNCPSEVVWDLFSLSFFNDMSFFNPCLATPHWSSDVPVTYTSAWSYLHCLQSKSALTLWSPTPRSCLLMAFIEDNKAVFVKLVRQLGLDHWWCWRCILGQLPSPASHTVSAT